MDMQYKSVGKRPFIGTGTKKYICMQYMDGANLCETIFNGIEINRCYNTLPRLRVNSNSPRGWIFIRHFKWSGILKRHNKSQKPHMILEEYLYVFSGCLCTMEVIM